MLIEEYYTNDSKENVLNNGTPPKWRRTPLPCIEGFPSKSHVYPLLNDAKTQGTLAIRGYLTKFPHNTALSASVPSEHHRGASSTLNITIVLKQLYGINKSS